jgi:hypothetical protein
VKQVDALREETRRALAAALAELEGCAPPAAG